MNDRPPALLMAIQIALALAILVSPLASLYAVRAGWVGFEFGVLLLLASLCYFSVLGGGGSSNFVVENSDQESSVRGDDRW